MEDTLSIDFLKYLVQYDENHNNCIHFDKLLPNGKSFFTSIESENEKIGEIVQLFFDKGVNPNAPDAFNVYPLQYAIYKKSYSFVITLINSKKIDFNVKFNKNTTYLHIAALSKYNILEAILRLDLIDINSKDDSGLIPIDVAKNHKSYKNVQLIKKVIEKGLSEAISSTKSENDENNDESPVDSLQQISEYLYYLDQFSNIKKKKKRVRKINLLEALIIWQIEDILLK